MTAIYVGNNTTVEVQALTNDATDTVDTAATVTCTLKTIAGVNVSGDTWPKAMPHVASGLYRATLDDDIAITAGRQYIVQIDATGSGGEVAHWECEVTAEIRRCPACA